MILVVVVCGTCGIAAIVAIIAIYLFRRRKLQQSVINNGRHRSSRKDTVLPRNEQPLQLQESNNVSVEYKNIAPKSFVPKAQSLCDTKAEHEQKTGLLCENIQGHEVAASVGGTKEDPSQMYTKLRAEEKGLSYPDLTFHKEESGMAGRDDPPQTYTKLTEDAEGLAYTGLTFPKEGCGMVDGDDVSQVYEIIE